MIDSLRFCATAPHAVPSQSGMVLRGRLVAAPLLVLMGCTKIETTQVQSYQPTSTRTERYAFSPWQGEVGVTARDGALLLQASQSRQCDVDTIRSGKSIVTTRRENDNLLGTWIAGIAGVAGASALAWGLEQHYNKGKPLENPGTDKGLTSQGYAVFLGSIGSIGLITATDAAIRSWDTSTSQPVENRSTIRQECERQPQAEALVQIVSNDVVLTEGKTDRTGALLSRCLPERLELLGAPAEVRVGGKPTQSKQLSMNFGIGSSSFSALRPTPVTYGTAASNQRLLLFGQQLARSERTPLVNEALRAGARKLDENAHISTFDITSLTWPHATRLKLLFNGHGVFVKAHWEGDYSGSRQTDLLRALSEKYGEPTRITRSEGTLLLRWAFQDNLEVQYLLPANKDLTRCPLAELSYVDPIEYAAFEAAVNGAK